MNTQKIDMQNGSLTKNILLFTLPIALSSMLQQCFNAADTSILGHFDSAASLAAVGTNGEIIAFIVSLSSGLSLGVNVCIASKIGKKETTVIPDIIGTSFLLALVIGFLGLVLGQCITASLLSLIQTPDLIFYPASLYLKIYFLGYPFLLLYDFGAAVLRAYGNSRYPFLALTVSGILNVLLNLVFVVVLHMGVKGVAIATDLSTAYSAIMVWNRIRKEIHLKNLHIQPSFCGPLLKIGIPSALQGAVFCFANIFVQASVNTFGSVAIAGSTIAMNFEYFSYYVITAFGQSATTFVSQNYAAGKHKRCNKILWLCILFSVLCSLLIIEPIILLRSQFSALFSNNPDVIENAVLRIMCILFFEPICGLYEIPAGFLRGTGHFVLPAVMTIIGTCAFRIIWICTVFRKVPSLRLLYTAFPVSWVLTIILIWSCFIILRFSKHPQQL